MDCNLAQELIMKRVETKLKAEEALGLHKHVLDCRDCRESYLVFEECMGALAQFDDGSFEQTAAPAGFTQSVMEKIGTAHSSEIEKVKEKGWLVLKLLWGFSAIILGVILFLLFNPYWLEMLTERYAAVGSVLYGLERAFAFLQSGIETMTQSVDFSSAGTMSAVALLFVAVMSLLLFALHSGERAT